MSRPNPVTFAAVLVLMLAALAGPSIYMGGLYVGKHEGDMLHLLQIVFRMEDGQWPHFDFMTPIGALAFAPIVAFLEAGFPIGKSIIYAQALVAIVLFPAIWWVGRSRLSPALAYLFGGLVLVLVLALVHGEAQRSVSISMHYNRWAWALSYIGIALALLSERGERREGVDGIILGLVAAALAMIKVTYLVAFLPGILVALLARKRLKTILTALLVGLGVAGAITVWAGPAFWLAYLQDLLAVAGSDVRSYPGEPVDAVIGAPLYLGGTLLLIASVILFRQAGQAVAGLALLILAPGFIYVVFQNFGNDPQWLPLLGVLVLALLPAAGTVNASGWDMRLALTIAGAMAFAIASPSVFNMAYSPFRHVATKTEDFALILPRSERHDDLYSANIRINRIDARIGLDGPGTGLERFAEFAERDEAGEMFGEPLEHCEVVLGLPGWFDEIGADLDRSGLVAGKRLIAADIFSSHWLFSELEPLVGGAPWFYGGLPGWESADYLLVPFCPVAIDVRAMVLESAVETGATFTEVRRTPLYALFEIGRP